MTCTEVQHHLSDYVDDHLAPAQHAAVADHLATCPGCRAARESLRALREQTKALPAGITPTRDLWAGIQARVECDQPVAAHHASIHPKTRQFPRLLRFALPLAAAAALAILLAPRFASDAPVSETSAGWAVATVAGNPRLAAQRLTGEGRLGVGEWLETDAVSQAKVKVGSIGEVTLSPNSRLRLVNDSTADHRLELARGRLDAFIWAPPRLFFVETPSAIAVDLGCAYTLEVDDAGHGELHVTSGYVALEHEGRESIVPAGVKCLTRVNAGPGTPFSTNASERLRAALARFDFGPPRDAPAALRDTLAASGTDDAITLWHLLARTDEAGRGLVFDRLAEFRPAPAGVTRDGIIAGEATMRRAWADEIGFGYFIR